MPLTILCETDEEMKYNKEKAMRCKIIALETMGKHPLQNPSLLSKKDKKNLLVTMEHLFIQTDAEIEEQFNEIVNDRLLNNEADVSQYPIYDLDAQRSNSFIHNPPTSPATQLPSSEEHSVLQSTTG